jgi:cell division protease FtsH
MSDAVGLARCAHRQAGAFLPGPDGTFQRDCSEQTAQEIDREVKRILQEAYADAKRVLSEHRDQLELVTRELLRHETLDAAAFTRLTGVSPARPERTGDPGELTPQSPGNGEHSHTE